MSKKYLIAIIGASVLIIGGSGGLVWYLRSRNVLDTSVFVQPPQTGQTQQSATSSIPRQGQTTQPAEAISGDPTAEAIRRNSVRASAMFTEEELRARQDARLVEDVIPDNIIRTWKPDYIKEQQALADRLKREASQVR